jgi:hypothetical protein
MLHREFPERSDRFAIFCRERSLISRATCAAKLNAAIEKNSTRRLMLPAETPTFTKVLAV